MGEEQPRVNQRIAIDQNTVNVLRMLLPQMFEAVTEMVMDRILTLNALRGPDFDNTTAGIETLQKTPSPSLTNLYEDIKFRIRVYEREANKWLQECRAETVSVKDERGKVIGTETHILEGVTAEQDLAAENYQFYRDFAQELKDRRISLQSVIYHFRTDPILATIGSDAFRGVGEGQKGYGVKEQVLERMLEQAQRMVDRAKENPGQEVVVVKTAPGKTNTNRTRKPSTPGEGRKSDVGTRVPKEKRDTSNS